MIPKQDRIKSRTVEDLERKYNGNMSPNATKQAESIAINKVDKTDYDEIVSMLNKATNDVVLPSNRIFVKPHKPTLDGSQRILELLRFEIADVPYRLCLTVEATANNAWKLVNQFIEPVEKQE